jgi:hypothetical protein
VNFIVRYKCALHVAPSKSQQRQHKPNSPNLHRVDTPDPSVSNQRYNATLLLELSRRIKLPSFYTTRTISDSETHPRHPQRIATFRLPIVGKHWLSVNLINDTKLAYSGVVLIAVDVHAHSLQALTFGPHLTILIDTHNAFGSQPHLPSSPYNPASHLRQVECRDPLAVLLTRAEG